MPLTYEHNKQHIINWRKTSTVELPLTKILK